MELFIILEPLTANHICHSKTSKHYEKTIIPATCPADEHSR